jgi:hypothetical protein
MLDTQVKRPLQILLRPTALMSRSQHLRDMPDLAIYREFGSKVVYFSRLKVSGSLQALSQRCRALGDDLAQGMGYPR